MRRFIIPVVLYLLAVTCSYGQQPLPESVTGEQLPKDTTSSPFLRKVSEAGARDQLRNQTTYRASSIAIRQRAIWNELIGLAREVKLCMSNGINLGNIATELQSIRQSYIVVQDGIFTNKGTAQTERNLSVSSAILYQLILATENRKKQVDKYTDDLSRYRNRMDSLLSDPVIYVFPKDSTAIVRYLQRMRVIVAEGDPSDNALNESLALAQPLQNSIDSLLFSLKVAQEKVESYRNELANINLRREFANIWDGVGYSRPFSEILWFSLAKERMALKFYSGENRLKIFCLLFLTTLVYFAIRSLKKKLREESHPDAENRAWLITKRPLASAIVLVTSICQFAFIGAPFIFSVCIWLVEVICLFLLIRGFIIPFWLRFWVIISLLFLLACLDNFVLQASRTERWIMAGLSLAGALYSCLIIFNRHRSELKEKNIIIFIRLFLFAESTSLLLNLFGRYNLSKVLLTVGYSGLITAILFIWVIRLINEGLELGHIVYKHPERQLFYINFSRAGQKAPTLLYLLLIVGWLIIVGRQFYAFKWVTAPFADFLHKERTLGDYSFSINGLFLFLLIMLCSLALSRIVSFFAADPQSTHGNINHTSKRSSWGSWILLVRIFIISLGLFLAFAAAGLPLDKITIVLGALSVGIGLGLQGLVSNLISGLIIAFEKPVKVGDTIEIGGKSGTMRSIGFRSSIVALADGANLVVPNSDLLNDHVINWSMAKNAKRLIIPLGVAYGTDLARVKTILESIVNGDERVLKSPAAFAAPKSFGESAINIDLVFWVRSQKEALVITGAIITAIDKVFKEEGIVIPFPQQDIYLHGNSSANNPKP